MIRMRTMAKGEGGKMVEGGNYARIREAPAPPGEEGTFQLYSEDYPSILTGLCTEEMWQEAIRRVNALWQPVHEESVAIMKSTSWWDYTMLAVFTRHRRQTKLAAQILEVAPKIEASLMEMINEKKLGFRIHFKQSNAKDESTDGFSYPLFHIAVYHKPADNASQGEASAGRAENG